MRQRRFLILASALILSLLVSIGSLTLVQPPIAFAYAYVIGSDPVDGSTVQDVPAVVRIFFDAPISSMSTAHVYEFQNGQPLEVNAAPSHVAPSNPRELDTLLRTAASLPKGSYEVNWTAVSTGDGHTTFGIIGFNVAFSSTGLSGTPTLGPSTSNTLDGPGGVRTLDMLGILAVAWQWLMLIALVAWVGMLALEHFLILADGGAGHISALLDAANRQTRALQWLCLATLLFSEFVLLLLRIMRLTQVLHGSFDFGVLFSLLTATHYGILWLLRIILILVSIGWLYWTSRRRSTPAVQKPAGQRRQPITRETSAITTTRSAKNRLQQEDGSSTSASMRPLRWLWSVLAVMIVVTYVLSDESTYVLQPHMSALLFDWLNLIAQSLWFGGLAYLGYVLLPLLPSIGQDQHTEVLISLLRCMTPLFLLSIGTMLISSLFLSEASIRTMQQLFKDAYGRTLLVQVSIIVVLLLFNVYILFVLCPKLKHQALLLPVVNAELSTRRSRQTALDQGERTLKRLVGIQAWLGAGILLCTALMAFFTPPIVFPQVSYTNARASSVSAVAQSNVQTQPFGDLLISLQVLPGHIGQVNSVILTLTGKNGQPVTDAQVQLTTTMRGMNMGTGHATIKPGNAVYVATFDTHTAFSMTGLWLIHVSIEQSGHPPVQGLFEVMLG